MVCAASPHIPQKLEPRKFSDRFLILSMMIFIQPVPDILYDLIVGYEPGIIPMDIRVDGFEPVCLATDKDAASVVSSAQQPRPGLIFRISGQ